MSTMLFLMVFVDYGYDWIMGLIIIDIIDVFPMMETIWARRKRMMMFWCVTMSELTMGMMFRSDCEHDDAVWPDPGSRHLQHPLPRKKVSPIAKPNL
jgi:hypothetical protein